jgi:uncharacterized protein (DUF169 family)
MMKLKKNNKKKNKRIEMKRVKDYTVHIKLYNEQENHPNFFNFVSNYEIKFYMSRLDLIKNK